MLQRTIPFEKPLDFLAAKTPDTRRAINIVDEWKKRLRRGDQWAEIITLTPSLAQILLSQNDANRVIKEPIVSRIVQDIKDGRWELNGEPIIIANTGELNDGQHRCVAVCRAATPIKTWITFGVARDTRLTVDQGATKTTGDYLQMDGVGNSNQLAAMARMVWQYENLGTVSNQPNMQPTKGQILETAALNLDGLAKSLAAIPVKGSGKVGSLGVLAFAHFIIARKNDFDAVTQFFLKIVNGENIESNDPAHAARERLLDERLRRGLPVVKVEVIFRAWQAHKAKRRMSRIQCNGSIPKV